MPINQLTAEGFGMLSGSGGASFIGLLDLYPNAAAAYAVRRLSSDYATPTNSEFSFGGALQFDGVNDYVSIGQNLSNVGDVTLSVWFKVNAFKGTYFSILGSDVNTGNYLMVRDVSGQLQCQGFGIFGNKQTLEPSTLGIWNHMGIIKSGANFTVYMNGTNYGSAASSTLSTINLFGKYGTNNSFNPANGVMDEFVWWNTALTEAQILNQWNGGNGNSANIDVEPLLWYNCNEEDGSSTLVNSGSGGASYNGTLINFDTNVCWVDGKANKGALLEIRRSSDNLVKNFYYDSNNELSLNSKDCNGTTLSSWIGSDDGFVSTWYDQSGNAKNVQQTTASKQPRIVNSGVVETKGTKNSIFFNSANSQTLGTTAIPLTDGFTAITVGSTNNNTTEQNFYDNTEASARMTSIGLNLNAANRIGSRASSNGAVFFGSGENLSSTNLILVDHYGSISSGSESNQLRLDGVDGTQNYASRIFASGFDIGSRSGAFYLNGYVSEFIYYTADKSAEISAIESNINTYYSIYSPPSGIGTWAIGTTFIIQ